jgi:predicted ATPase
MSQLRAELARLAREAEERSDAAEIVRPVYDLFTEGFDTPDLVEARAVLNSREA